MAISADDILQFWFAGENRVAWFGFDASCDAAIRERFETTWEQARDGLLAHWAETPRGALALVIVLDQFPLNMFRDAAGQALRYSTEAASRTVAGRAIARGFDARLDADGKVFLYLPYMHSETLADQERAVQLFAAAGLDDNVRWAEHHRDIVRRFGRFPHRNAALGRVSTAEETAWLASDEAFSA